MASFLKLKDCDKEDHPLSLFALQRKVWTDTKGMAKSQLIERIDTLYKNPTYELVTDTVVMADNELHVERKYFNIHNSDSLCLPIVTAQCVLKRFLYPIKAEAK